MSRSSLPSRRAAVALLVLGTAVAATPPAQAGDHTRFGVMVDAGLPDGANGSLIYRPRTWLRLHGGGGYNAVSPGVRAGVSLVPLYWFVTPALIVEAGRYFDGDANPLMRTISGDPEYHNELLQEVGYDYANAHLGLEVGSRRVTVFVHAGVSYIRSDIANADSLFRNDDGSSDVSFRADPRLSGLVPSARLGLILYLY